MSKRYVEKKMAIDREIRLHYDEGFRIGILFGIDRLTEIIYKTKFRSESNIKAKKDLLFVLLIVRAQAKLELERLRKKSAKKLDGRASVIRKFKPTRPMTRVSS